MSDAPPDRTDVRVTVLGIELATREDITLAQKANASLVNALRADLLDSEQRIKEHVDNQFAEVQATLAAILAKLGR